MQQNRNVLYMYMRSSFGECDGTEWDIRYDMVWFDLPKWVMM